MAKPGDSDEALIGSAAWPAEWRTLDPALREAIKAETRAASLSEADGEAARGGLQPTVAAPTRMPRWVRPPPARRGRLRRAALGDADDSLRLVELSLPLDPALDARPVVVLADGPDGCSVLHPLAPEGLVALEAFAARGERRVLQIVVPEALLQAEIVLAFVGPDEQPDWADEGPGRWTALREAVESGRAPTWGVEASEALLGGPAPAAVQAGVVGPTPGAAAAAKPADEAREPGAVEAQGPGVESPRSDALTPFDAPSADPMTAILRLGTDEDPAAADLIRAHTVGVVGRLDPGRLLSVAAWLTDELAPPVGLQLPSYLPAAARKERAAAEALARGLLGAPKMASIRDHLCALRGAAAERGLTLGLELNGPIWSAIPWELLQALPGNHVLAGLRIVRLVPAQTRWVEEPPREKLQVLLWCPDPDDLITSQFREPLRAFLDSLDRVSVVDLPADLAALPPPSPGAFPVLHVLGHGRRSAELLSAVALQLADGRQASTDQVCRQLGELLKRCRLGVLEVCEGAAGSVASLDAPAPRLVAGGVPLCVAPARELAAAASSAFVEGLYTRIAEGASLLDAVQEGRRRLDAASPSAHPAWRWWTQALVASDVRAAGPALLARPPLLPGWPPASGRLVKLVRGVLAMGAGHGFLGVEHVAIALAEGLGGAAVQAALRPHRETLRDAFSHLSPLSTAEPPRPTPRLQQLGAQLEPGFSAWDLVAALCRMPSMEALLGAPALAALKVSPRAAQETWYSTTALPARRALLEARERLSTAREPDGTLQLEVLGGPDDGRRLSLKRAGDWLGRWGGSTEERGTNTLFDGAASTGRVSRRHLEYLGGDRVRLAASAIFFRFGEPPRRLRISRSAPESERPVLELRPFDRLLLDVRLGGQGALLEVLATP